MPYVIQNARSGSYMCYDLNHRLSATSNVRKAESFEDSGKAYNVLTHCYPKSQRPDWQVVELPREAAKGHTTIRLFSVEHSSKELLSLRHLRVSDDFLRRSLFNDLSTLQEDDTVGDLTGKANLMCSHEDR